MFFCSRLPEEDAVRAREAGREKVLQLLISDMHCAFPDLTFELRLNFRIINAQALRLPGKRIVILYGGLALHPDLAANSLALILLHEAGHHSASGCRLGCDPSVCWAADWELRSRALLTRSRPPSALRRC